MAVTWGPRAQTRPWFTMHMLHRVTRSLIQLTCTRTTQHRKRGIVYSKQNSKLENCLD